VRVNEFDQPVGEPVAWTPPPVVSGTTLSGRTCRVEPLTGDHLDALHVALVVDSPPQTWTYMSAGPFSDKAAFGDYLASLAGPGRSPHVILDAAGRPRGIACYLRITPEVGSVEVGAITYSTALRRTTAATEAMHLMADHAFELGYRRYEWKCDALNAASRRAAERLGFRYEGTFRNALVYKGRNRDTAWFSITDVEWPRVREAHRAWLAPENFDDTGSPVRRLGGLTAVAQIT
jgi:RimJ/RimL family protein N-acetyltransferase